MRHQQALLRAMYGGRMTAPPLLSGQGVGPLVQQQRQLGPWGCMKQMQQECRAWLMRAELLHPPTMRCLA